MVASAATMLVAIMVAVAIILVADERLSFYYLTAIEKSATVCTEQFGK